MVVFSRAGDNSRSKVLNTLKFSDISHGCVCTGVRAIV